MTLTAKEFIKPAKTQGELMSYRQGYTKGLSEGKRVGMEAAAKIAEEITAYTNHQSLQSHATSAAAAGEIRKCIPKTRKSGAA